MTRWTTALRTAHPLWGVAALFAGAVALVGPLRETTAFDDWSNARMVLHLLRTGEHRAHAWVAADPVAQIEWGALFSRLLGYSHSSLRLSTLVLAAVALLTFYFLSLEHGLDRRESAGLTAVLLASPLFVGLSFSFMTDVPFLAVSLLAVLLTTKALRLDDLVLAILASLATSTAILIHPLGAMIVPALALARLRSREHARDARFLVAALLLPLIAIATRLYEVAVRPTWTARQLLFDERAFLFRPALPLELLWRPVVLLVYLALLAFPLVVLALMRLVLGLTSPPESRPADALSRETVRLAGLWLAASSLVLAGGAAFGRPWKLPLLPGILEGVEAWPRALAILLTAAAVVGASRLVLVLVRRYRDPSRRNRTSADRFFDFASAGFLLAQILFVQLDDTGSLLLLPFALVLVGRELSSTHGIAPGERRVLALVSLVTLLVSALWIRGQLSRGEAEWSAARVALQTGAPANSIASSWEWNAYSGAFDRFVASRDETTADQSLDAAREEFFSRWLPQQAADAVYTVTELDRPPTETAEQRLLAAVGFRDSLFRKRQLFVLGRPAFVVEECTGGFPRESDATSWWHWTAGFLECRFRSRLSGAATVVVGFTYWTPAQGRDIRMTVDGNAVDLRLLGGRNHAYRSQPLRVAAGPIVVRFQITDGSKPFRLTPRSTREASFLIKNLQLEQARSR